MAGTSAVVASQQAIHTVAADLELHLRAIGLDLLKHGEEIPEWLWNDLEESLRLQGVLWQ